MKRDVLYTHAAEPISSPEQKRTSAEPQKLSIHPKYVLSLLSGTGCAKELHCWPQFSYADNVFIYTQKKNGIFGRA